MGEEESAKLMNQIAYPFVNRRSIELGLIPPSSLLGTISVVFHNEGWRANFTDMREAHSPTHGHMRFAISKNNQPPSAMPTGQ
jgi:hypothetical protein